MQAEEQHHEHEQPLDQPQGDLQHPRGPSGSISSDGEPRVNGQGTGGSSNSTRSLSSVIVEGSTAAAAETAATTKREGHRRKGNTWLDIFSFGRWRPSSNRPPGAIQLAQAFGAPNQPGRPVRTKHISICFSSAFHSLSLAFVSGSPFCHLFLQPVRQLEHSMYTCGSDLSCVHASCTSGTCGDCLNPCQNIWRAIHISIRVELYTLSHPCVVPRFSGSRDWRVCL